MQATDLIMRTKVPKGQIAIFYFAQAGFCFKTHIGTIAGLDLYLSDCCERMFGFKRQIHAPAPAEELDLDILIATHSHADHLDPDTLPVFAKKPKTIFVGACDCAGELEKAGFDNSRVILLSPGQNVKIRDMEIRAIYADHGELAPDAIGLLFSIDGMKIYHVGDTAYRPNFIRKSLGDVKIDVMISPINGAFGNMTAKETCELAKELSPGILIPCHYGMFESCGGGLDDFKELSKSFPKTINPAVMEPGQCTMLKPGNESKSVIV